MKSQPFKYFNIMGIASNKNITVKSTRNIEILDSTGNLILITNQQAMDFWGLVDSEPVIVSGDINKKEKMSSNR